MKNQLLEDYELTWDIPVYGMPESLLEEINSCTNSVWGWQVPERNSPITSTNVRVSFESSDDLCSAKLSIDLNRWVLSGSSSIDAGAFYVPYTPLVIGGGFARPIKIKTRYDTI